MRNVKLFQQLIKPVFARLAILLDHFENGTNIVFNRKTTEDRSFLRQIADAKPCSSVHWQRVRNGRNLQEQLDILMKEGFSRVDVGEQFYRIDELIDQQQLPPSEEVLLVIDRLPCSPDKATVNRLSDSVQTAFLEGNGECIVRFWGEEGMESFTFSNRFEADGITFEEPTEMMFNFNSPMGACPKCEGFGKVMGIDESLVIPDKSLSLQEECVQCWRGEKMSEWRREFAHNAYKVDFPIHRAYYDLTEEEKELLWNGHHEQNIYGINDFFGMLEKNLYKIQYRVMLARYRGKTVCPLCKGARLKPAALHELPAA